MNNLGLAFSLIQATTKKQITDERTKENPDMVKIERLERYSEVMQKLHLRYDMLTEAELDRIYDLLKEMADIGKAHCDKKH